MNILAVWLTEDESITRARRDRIGVSPTACAGTALPSFVVFVSPVAGAVDSVEMGAVLIRASRCATSTSSSSLSELDSIRICQHIEQNKTREELQDVIQPGLSMCVCACVYCRVYGMATTAPTHTHTHMHNPHLPPSCVGIFSQAAQYW